MKRLLILRSNFTIMLIYIICNMYFFEDFYSTLHCILLYLTTLTFFFLWNYRLTMEKIYSITFLPTNSAKLKWLQYQINHIILITNNIMFQIGKVDSKLGNLCYNEEETICHLINKYKEISWIIWKLLENYNRLSNQPYHNLK